MTNFRARHYVTNQPVEVSIRNSVIESVTPIADEPNLPWIAPTFCDVQINGCLGFDFGSPQLTIEQVRTVADECRRHGIGRLCPTIITGGFDAVRHGFTTLAAACDSDPDLNFRLPKFHLEGPYLSGEDGPRGAHPREHIRDPNWDEFQRWQEAAGGRIGMVTVAPERTGAIAFIEKLASAEIVVAIGHTAATAEQLRDAIRAGAKTSTHLGNGCQAVLPRHPNIIWEQLAADELWASIICDGHHLSGSIVKSIVRGKTIARTLITCDASSLAGLPPGRYTHWSTELDVLPGGKVVVPGTPYLAGSGVFTDVCVSTVIQQAGVSLQDAVDMAAIRPRELMGLPVPRIEVGQQPAEVMLFDWQQGHELTVREVISL